MSNSSNSRIRGGKINRLVSSLRDHTSIQEVEAEKVELFFRFMREERMNVVKLIERDFNKQNDFSRFLETQLDNPVTLIGAGKMGSALLKSWLSLGLTSELITIVEPKPSRQIVQVARANNVQLVGSINNISAVSVLFLAIKPQVAETSLTFLAPLIRNDTLVISIMAGKSISRISDRIDRNVAIVRAMPNLPASIGRGITVAVKNDIVTYAQKTIAHVLLRATGEVVWTQNEDLMDAVTAVSGSGPAYVFLLAEIIARAGAAAGLPSDLSKQLARETVAGSGELLYLSPDDASKLRESVTSEGGTTEAALNVLMDKDGLYSLFEKAVLAARDRSRELAD